jgi:hypothetical protein
VDERNREAGSLASLKAEPRLSSRQGSTDRD